MMNARKRFYYSLIGLQFIFAFIAYIVIMSVIPFGAAQTGTSGSSDPITILGLSIAAAIAIAGAVIGSGMAIKTVGTAAISALTENEGVFMKAFLVVALAEALAIYGLIVSILLWIKIP